MRVLVAGCAGFIGFHLCERLLADGHEVVGVDNLATGQRRNADDLLRVRRFRFLEHDICQPLPRAALGRIDLVCNLACPASPVDFGTRPLEIMAVCSRGLWNLLDLARELGARLLQTSTSEIYGDPLEHPQRETYWGNVNPAGPRSCYDEGKRFGEALIAAYRRQYRTPIRVARIFNTYGPRMRADDGRALPNFISQALSGRPLTVHGDGRQTRSFCYVADQVEGLLRLAASEVEEPVNIGNPVEVTLLEVAREVIELSGSRSTITHTDRMPDDPKVRCPDISRARTLLGWEPHVARREGLLRTIAWFRQAENV
ncbi:MAG: SDR family oxidoreductase [Phycisphaerae bacterium]|nr:SDR family oxidoreductase [Phycisphaerae bacterium]MCZ2400896.1 SDR family oxidoreductase [Phycisphaerae bacterium]NUQ50025.1 SDR family oxidoreductase [Phycisphaerae bacterium]